MSTISTHLKKYGSVRTGWADRFQSDRILNSNEMICPIPNNVDIFGRNADPNSFVNKTAGCHSALDRVQIEDDQRPKAFSDIYLNPMGLNGYNCTSFTEEEKKYYEEDTPLTEEGYKLLSQYVSFPGLVPPDTAIIRRNLKRRELQWVRLGQKDLYYKSLSGCL
jgi:hypothetical protein